MGSHQEKAYLDLVGRQLSLSSSPLLLKFGNSTHGSLGKMGVPIPIPNGGHISIDTYIVPEYISFLLGLYVLTANRLILNFSVKTISQQGSNWHIPLTRLHGHIFLQCP